MSKADNKLVGGDTTENIFKWGEMCCILLCSCIHVLWKKNNVYFKLWRLPSNVREFFFHLFIVGKEKDFVSPCLSMCACTYANCLSDFYQHTWGQKMPAHVYLQDQEFSFLIYFLSSVLRMAKKCVIM